MATDPNSVQSIIGSGSSTAPISNIIVLPSYGFNTCVITWSLDRQYLNSNLYGLNIYKSRDGHTDWFKINTALISPVESSFNVSKTTYADTNFVNRNQVINWHYSIELVGISYQNNSLLETTIYQSGPVGIFYSLNEAEYSTLRTMIQNEVLQADDVQVYLLRPKGLEGSDIMNPTKPTPTVDFLTQEQSGVSTDTSSYGQTFLEGYSNPILTQIDIQGIQTKQIDDQQGNGTKVVKIANIEGFSYPRLVRGDMIVLPKTDERYFFNEYTQETFFKSIYPFRYSGTMQLIPRNQVEYKIPLRELERCCINQN